MREVRKRKVDAEPLTALQAGIAEANRRERGAFDGLLGQLHDGASKALQDVVSDLRDYLLDRFSEAEVRSLLREYEPRPDFRHVAPVPDDMRLALRLLNNIRSAMRCESKRLDVLILGELGARDKKRQAGSSKGGVASVAARSGENSKSAAIIKAAKVYRGAPASRAVNIARKVGVSPQYVRLVLKREKGI